MARRQSPVLNTHLYLLPVLNGGDGGLYGRRSRTAPRAGGWLRASSSDPFLRSLLLGGLVCGVVEVDAARPRMGMGPWIRSVRSYGGRPEFDLHFEWALL